MQRTVGKVALPAPLARLCSRRFQSWRFDRSRYCIRREWGVYSTVCVFSSEAAGCSSATIVRSPTCPVETTAATSGLDPGAAGSGFDVGSDKHWLSASCDQPRHGLTFSRLAISRVMAFEFVISRASTVFTGGISASGFAAAVATAGVCTGANANAPRGSELLSATMSPMPLVPAISPRPIEKRASPSR